MKTLRAYKKKTLLGVVDGENIYLSSPSWDCGWYWGFGYLGNENCHYHLDGIAKNENLHDGLIKHFGKSFVIRISQIWTFAELIKTFYGLKDAAELFGRGGSHLTSNPCQELIKNEFEVKRINEVVLPALFDAIYKLLEENTNNKQLFSELVRLNNEGNSLEVVKFMFANKIHTDDLRGIEGITDHDFNIIHNLYWRTVHKKKES